MKKLKIHKSITFIFVVGLFFFFNHTLPAQRIILGGGGTLIGNEFTPIDGGITLSYQNCHINDWTALKALYYSTDGSNWTNYWSENIFRNALPPRNCNLGNLYGIILNNDGRVVSIDLEDNQLSGTITAQINSLNYLEELNLSVNQISGGIPNQIVDLSSLKELNLSENQLNGSIPNQIGDLTNLEKIRLNHNQLTGSMPTSIVNLSSLDFLKLNDNQLSGTIPNGITNLVNLIRFQLNDNELTGSIPTDLSNLNQLDRIYLHNNQLNGVIPINLDSCANLHTLNLSNNQLTGTIPIELGNLTLLEYLRLGDNQFSGTIPASLVDLVNLNTLNLSNNQLNGEIPTNIDNITSLEHLLLDNNALTGTIPIELGNLTLLEYVHLNDNQFSGTIPTSLGSLEYLTNLNLGNNQLTGSIPTQLGNLSELEYLRLSQNQLTGEIPPQFGNLSALTNLNLRSNKLTGSIPSTFGNLMNLTYLALYENFLTGVIPDSFSQLNNLETLRLRDNQITGTIPNFASSLSNLNIYNNYFTCAQIESVDITNLEDFDYEPQYIKPINYDSIQSNVVHTAEIGNVEIVLNPALSNSTGFSYRWLQNNTYISEQSNTLNLQEVEPEDAGRYYLKITDTGCSLADFEYKTDPMYVIVEGYDLHGQPVEYNQIMVEFENPEITEINEETILDLNGGWVADYCNCNRELYLWQFPSTDAAVQALIEIDKKNKNIKNTDGDVDGGLNNQLRVFEDISNNTGYRIVNDPFENNDDVRIFIIDTGFDDTNFSTSPFLNSTAPVDQCYGITSDIGYSYLDTASISTNYIDEVWHGTFGFDVITDSFDSNQNIEIIPLKVFNNEGKGNLFDLTCAIYHAIDHDAQIINISAGYQGQHSSILERAINFARENDVFICTAAGNDNINIDETPQFPASFANRYHYIYDGTGENIIDSIRYDNVISVGSIDINDNKSVFSNSGANSVTLFAIGEDIVGEGLNNMGQVAASGTSMATFLVTRKLALEIAENNNRNYNDILNDFQTNCLTDYDGSPSIMNKKLNINLETVNLKLNNSEDINKEISAGTFSLNSRHHSNINSLRLANSDLYITYSTVYPGFLDVEIVDVNGRILNNVIQKPVEAGNQLITLGIPFQIPNTLGIYFIITRYKSANQDVIVDSVKLIISK